MRDNIVCPWKYQMWVSVCHLVLTPRCWSAGPLHLCSRQLRLCCVASCLAPLVVALRTAAVFFFIALPFQPPLTFSQPLTDPSSFPIWVKGPYIPTW